MRRSSSCSTDSDTGSTFSVFPAVYVRFGMPCVVIEYEALRKLGWSWCDITVNKFDGVSQPGTEYLCPQEYEVFLPRGDVMLADRNEASHRLHIAACIIKLALATRERMRSIAHGLLESERLIGNPSDRERHSRWDACQNQPAKLLRAESWAWGSSIIGSGMGTAGRSSFRFH